jgi:L-asparaginase
MTVRSISNVPTTRARVAVFYKGGTMGMEPDETGTLYPSKGYLSEQLANMTELAVAPGMLEVTVFEDDELVDSSDMGPSDWTAMAADIAKHYCTSYLPVVLLCVCDMV